MKSVNKLVSFLKKSKSLERLNKNTGEWETVDLDLSDDETYILIQVMSAELEIMVRIEEMELELRLKNK
tara:strand:- start:372 stop:578 length:207 start_codon:yes stop_codon:yes gene_type:complete